VIPFRNEFGRTLWHNYHRLRRRRNKPTISGTRAPVESLITRQVLRVRILVGCRIGAWGRQTQADKRKARIRRSGISVPGLSSNDGQRKHQQPNPGVYRTGASPTSHRARSAEAFPVRGGARASPVATPRGPRVFDVMERIKSRTRTQGRRYGSGFDHLTRPQQRRLSSPGPPPPSVFRAARMRW
jgi:hypothetical protein